MKLLPLGAELFQADGQTNKQTNIERNMTKLIVSFHNFANAPLSCCVASQNKSIWNHLI